jgi:hypothetical protein
MMQMPKRSVTRFFIPMVDVMTLLFSMFLLMPIVEKASKEERAQAINPEQEKKDDIESLKKELNARLDEIEELRDYREKGLTLEQLKEATRELKQDIVKHLNRRIAVFIINVEIKGGKAELSYKEPGMEGEPIILDQEVKVKRMIRDHRELLEGTEKEPYYYFQGARLNIGEVQRYEKWFNAAATNLG